MEQEGKDGKMIKLAAVDMDGTLLRSDGHISDRTAHTIRCMQTAGIEFIICTGRNYWDAARPLMEQKIKAPIICMNGAAVYNWQGELLSKILLEREQVNGILKLCRNEPVLYDFMTGEGSLTLNSPETFRQVFENGKLFPMATKAMFEAILKRFRFASPEELFQEGREIFKISLVHEDGQALQKIRDSLEEVGLLSVFSSDASNLEITHAAAQKGKALAEYAAMRGVRFDEMMAIGDSENDYSMLSMNLKYTVAMENGMDIIKRVAKCQTRSNDEDGAAYAIETLALVREAAAM